MPAESLTLDLDELERLTKAATPGPYVLQWPAAQGGAFQVWGKQGSAPFQDGWAIPLVASGVDSNMAYIAALVNAAPELIRLARLALEARDE